MQKFKKVSDEELVALLLQEDISAFEEIYNRYWATLYTAAYKRIKSKEGAEEIVQNVFTALWANREKTNIRTSLAAYLHCSVRYQVFNFFNKEYNRKSYELSVRHSFSTINNSTEETVLLKDLLHTIENQVNLLPAKCRSVYELSRNKNKTNKEIAAELGISEKTVENHLTKALRKIRVHLNGLFVFILLLFAGRF